jgi:hypothetical protein
MDGGDMFNFREAPEGGAMFDKLMAGVNSPGMFNLLASGYPEEPKPGEIEKEKAEAMRYDRKVTYEGLRIRQFDFSDHNQVSEYEQLRKEMYDKVRTKLWVVSAMERRYTEAEGRPRWLMYVEWHQYRYVKRDLADGDKVVVDTAKGIEENESDS